MKGRYLKRVFWLTLALVIMSLSLCGAGLAEGTAADVKLADGVGDAANVYYGQNVYIQRLFAFTDAEGNAITEWPDNAELNVSSGIFGEVIHDDLYVAEGAKGDTCTVTATLTGTEISASVTFTMVDSTEYAFLSAPLTYSRLATYGGFYSIDFELYNNLGDGEQRVMEQGDYKFVTATTDGNANVSFGEGKVHLSIAIPSKAEMSGKTFINFAITPENPVIDADMRTYYGVICLVDSMADYPFDGFDIEFPEGSYGIPQTDADFMLKLYPTWNGERVSVNLNDYTYKAEKQGDYWGGRPDPTAKVSSDGKCVELTARYFGTDHDIRSGVSLNAIRNNIQFTWFYFWPEEICWNYEVTKVEARMESERRTDGLFNDQPYFMPGDKTNFHVFAYDANGICAYRDPGTFYFFQTREKIEGDNWTEWKEYGFREVPDDIFDTSDAMQFKTLDHETELRIRAYAYDGNGNFKDSVYSEIYTIVGEDTGVIPLLYDDNYHVRTDPGEMRIGINWTDAYDGLKLSEDLTAVISNAQGITFGDINYDSDDWAFDMNVTNAESRYGFDIKLVGELNGIPAESTIRITTDDIDNKSGVTSYDLPLGMSVSAEKLFNIDEKYLQLVDVVCEDEGDDDERLLNGDEPGRIEAERPGKTRVYLYSALDFDKDWNIIEGKTPLAGPVEVTISDGGYDYYRLKGEETVHMEYGQPKDVVLTLYGYTNDIPHEIAMSDANYVYSWDYRDFPDEMDADAASMLFSNGKLIVKLPACSDSDPDYDANMDGGSFSVHIRPVGRDDLNPIEYIAQISVFEPGKVPAIAGFVLDDASPDLRSGFYDNNRSYTFYYLPVDEQGNVIKTDIPAQYAYEADYYEVHDEEYNPRDVEAGEKPEIVLSQIAAEGSRLKVVLDVNIQPREGETECGVNFGVTCYAENNFDTPRVARFESGLYVYTPSEEAPVAKDVEFWLGIANCAYEGVIPVGGAFDVGCHVLDENGEHIEGYPVDIKYQYKDASGWVTASVDQLKNGIGFPAKLTGNQEFDTYVDFVALDKIGAKIRAILTIELNGEPITFSTGVFEIVEAADSVALKGGVTSPYKAVQYASIPYESVFDVKPAGAAFYISDSDNGTDIYINDGFIDVNENRVGISKTFKAYALGGRAKAVDLAVEVGNDRIWAYLDSFMPNILAYDQHADNIETVIQWMTEYDSDTGEETFERFDLRNPNNKVTVTGTNGIEVWNPQVNGEGNLLISVVAPKADSDYNEGYLKFTVTDGVKTKVFDHSIRFVDEIPTFDGFEIDNVRTQMDAMPFDGGEMTIFLKPTPAYGHTGRISLNGYSFITRLGFGESGYTESDLSPEQRTFTHTVHDGGEDDDYIELTGYYFAPKNDDGGITGADVFAFKGTGDSAKYLFNWGYYPNVICEKRGIVSAKVKLIEPGDTAQTAVTTADVGDDLEMVVEFFDGDGNKIENEGIEFAYYLSVYDGGEWVDLNDNPGDEYALAFGDQRWHYKAVKPGMARALVRVYKDDGTILNAYSGDLTVNDFPFVKRDEYRQWINTNNGKVYACMGWLEEFDEMDFGNDWIITPSNMVNCAVSDCAYEGLTEWDELEFSFDVVPASGSVFSFDVLLKGTVDGMPCSDTITVDNMGIGNKAGVTAYTLPKGMNVNAGELFAVKDYQMQMLGGYAEYVSGDEPNEDVVNAWEPESIYAERVGEANVWLYSLLDFNDEGELKEGAAPLTPNPVKITVVDEGYDDYELKGPDPVVMVYGESKKVEYTLYGYADNKDTEIPMDAARYEAEWDYWDIEEVEEPAFAFENGKLVFTVPAIADPDPAEKGDSIWSSYGLRVRPIGKGVSGFDANATVSVYETKPNVVAFKLDTAKGDYNPGSYVNNKAGEDYTLYYTPLDENGNETTIPVNTYVFEDDYYEVDWDGYDPYSDENEDDPYIKVTSMTVENNRLKVTFHLNYPGREDETVTDLGFWISCHYGADKNAPLSARFETYVQVYTPEATREAAGAEIWIDSSSSIPFTVPQGAGFHIGHEVFDINGDGIEGYPVTMTYQYLQNGVWTNATNDELINGKGVKFPATANSTDYVGNGNFTAVTTGVKFRAILTVEFADGIKTFASDVFEVVKAATSVSLKNGSSIEVPRYSATPLENVFAVVPSDAAFIIKRANEDSDIYVDWEGGFINAGTDTVGEKNVFTAYAPGKRTDAVKLTVTVSDDLIWAYINGEVPSIMSYGTTVSDLEMPIEWITEYDPATHEETYEHLDLNDANNSYTLKGFGGVKVTGQSVNAQGNIVSSFTAPAENEGGAQGGLIFVISNGNRTAHITEYFKFYKKEDMPAFDDFTIDFDKTEIDAMPFDGEPLTIYLRPTPVYGNTERISLSGYSFESDFNYNGSGYDEDNLPAKQREFTVTVKDGGTESDYIELTGRYFAPKEGFYRNTGVELHTYKGTGSEAEYLFSWGYNPNVICTKKGVASATVKLVKLGDETETPVTMAQVGDKLQMAVEFFDANGNKLTGDDIEYGYYLSSFDGTDWTDYNGAPGDDCALGFGDGRWRIDAVKAGKARAFVRAYKDDGTLLTAYSEAVEVRQNMELTVDPEAILVYAGSEIKPKVSVTLIDGEIRTTLESDDYTVSYENNINVGLATAKVTFKGDYGYLPAATADFYITPKTLTAEMVKWPGDAIPALSYNRMAQEPQVEVKDGNALTEEKDYELDYINNTAVSVDGAVARITGIGNYTGSVELKFSIKQYELNSTTATVVIADQVWTGEKIIPAATVMDSFRQALTPDADYTVTVAAESANVGDYTAKITGVGSYTGSVDKQFNIVKAPQAAPTGITAAPPSIKGYTDGKIIGVTDKMKYKAEKDTGEYKTGNGSDIIGSAGVYLVRFAENENQLEGEDARIVVPEGTATLTVTFDPNYTEGSVQKVAGLSYGSTAIAPDFARDGYTLDGWKTVGGKEWESAKTEVTSDITVYAKWKAGEASFNINHYQQTLNASEYTLFETTRGTGTVGKETTETGKDYTGFEPKLPIKQSVIAADGSAVVDVYYDRVAYSVKFMDGETVVNGSGAGESVIYGKQIMPPEVSKEGSIFTGWKDADGNSVGFPVTVTKELTYNATWKEEEAEEITYTVNHLRMGLDGNYGAAFESEEAKLKVAAADAQTTLGGALRKDYTGFTFNKCEAVVGAENTYNIYYERNKYKLTVTDNDKLSVTKPADGEIYYGQMITLTAEVNDSVSYGWKRWSSDNDNLLASSNNASYKFQMPAGDATLKPEVTPNSFKLTFDAKGGLGGYTRTVAFGTAIGKPADPTKLGYEFKEWQNATGDAVNFTNLTMPAKDTVFTASWTFAKNTPYTVEHYLEELSGGYVLAKTENDVGATDAKTAVSGDSTYIGDGKGFSVHGSIVQQTITADGAAVVEVYYDRNVNDLTFTAGGFNMTRSVKFGAGIQAPSITRQGYDITGWQDSNGTEVTFPLIMPDAELELTAMETPRTDTHYQLKHVQQGMKADYSDAEVVQIENKIGTTGTDITSGALRYTGFGTGVIQQVNGAAPKINGNGATVAEVRYARNTHKLTFSDGYTANDKAYNDVMYGAKIADIEIPAFTRDGYAFDGWSPAIPETMPDSDVTFTARWSAGTTDYDVEHYLQNLDGTYPTAPASTDTRKGAVGASVTAAEKRFTGYELSKTAANVVSGEIPESGKLTLKLYYDRKSYTLSYNLNGGTMENAPAAQTLKYGASFASPTGKPTRVGYEFDAWSPESGTMPVKNLTVTALWKAKTSAKYTVVSNYETVTGEYISDSKSKSALFREDGSDTTVAAEIETRTGMVLDTAKSVTKGILAKDDSLVLNLYYNLVRSKFTFDANGGVGGLTRDVAYTATLAAPAVSKEGYTLTGWEPAVPTAAPEVGATYAAQWKGNDATYTVEHYQQGLDGNYHFFEKKIENSKVGTEVTAQVNTYEGFEKPIETASGKVTSDNKLTLKLYYPRTTYDLTFRVLGDSGDAAGKDASEVLYENTEKVMYGASIVRQVNVMTKAVEGTGSVTVPTPVSDTSYLAGWDKDGDGKADTVPATMPANAGGVTLDTVWVNKSTAASYTTTYYVPGEGQTTTTAYGTKGDTVNAETPDKAGYVLDTGNAANVLSGKIPDTGTLQLHVYYKVKTYDLKLNYDAGILEVTVDPENNGGYAGGTDVTVTAKLRTDAVKKYGFTGWISTYGTVASGNVDAKGEFAFVVPTGPVELTAAVAPKTYKANFDVIGGTIGTPPASYEYSESAISLPIPVSNDPAKGFAGWKIDGSEKLYKEIPAGMTPDDAANGYQFTAVFNDIIILTFKADGGKFADGTDIKTLTGLKGDTFTAPAAPTLTDKVFDGWDEDIPATFETNTTFTAKWKDGGDTPTPPDPEKPVVKLNAESKLLYIGASTELSYTVTPAGYEAKSVVWTSSDPKVATVTGNGASATVNALSAGKATVSVKVDEMTASCLITVESAGDFRISGISGDTLEIKQGDTRTFAFENAPDGIKLGINIKDETIAKGSVSGLSLTVSGLKPGETAAEIVSLGADGKTEGDALLTFKIKVTKKDDPQPVEGVLLLDDVLLGKGMKVKLTNLLPYGFKGIVTWAASDASVAKINAKGMLIGVKTGTAVVTAFFEDGTSETVEVRVIEKKLAVKKITAPSKLNLLPLTSKTVNAQIKPASANDKMLKWFTSDENVAAVAQDGTITAKKPGTAYVTALATSGARKVITVKVKKFAAITEWAISETELTLKVGETKLLAATVIPDEADQKVTWLSAKPKIAKVGKASGLVTAVKPGTTTVTCAFANGKKLKCTVTVVE